MDTERLNRWIALGANLAVLVGLVALVVELGTNTAAIRAASVQESVNSSREYLLNIALNEDFSRIRQTGSDNYTDLSESEAFRLGLSMRGSWLFHQNVWIQRELGVIDERAWGSRYKIICGIFTNPGLRQDWEHHKLVLDTKFVELVEGCLD